MDLNSATVKWLYSKQAKTRLESGRIQLLIQSIVYCSDHWNQDRDHELFIGSKKGRQQDYNIPQNTKAEAL